MSACPLFARNRLFEWVMAATLFSLGVHLVLFPLAVQHSSFRHILRLFGPHDLAMFFLAAGGLRLAALIANGRWHYGPLLRMLGAAAGALLWFEMALALALLLPQTGVPSPGIPVYFALTCGEVASAFRTGKDMAARGRGRDGGRT